MRTKWVTLNFKLNIMKTTTSSSMNPLHKKIFPLVWILGFVMFAQQPSAPFNLTLSNVTSTGFTLAWENDPNATATEIYIEDPAANSGDVFIETVAMGVTSYDYSGTYGSVTIQEGGNYVARIRALPDGNFNAFASIETNQVLPPIDPDAPTNLMLSNQKDTSFTLTWENDQNSMGTNIFIVDEAAGSGDVYITTLEAGATTFDYSGTYGSVTIQDGGIYLAKIQSLPDDDFSAFAQVSTDGSDEPKDPQAPTNLTLSNQEDTSFTLTWENDANSTGTNVFIVDEAAGSGDIYITTLEAGVTAFDYSGTYGSVTIQKGGVYLAKIQSLPDDDFTAFAQISTTNDDLNEPEAPFNLNVSDVGETSFTLNWENAANTTGTNIFIVEPSTSSGDIYIETVGSDVNSYTYTGTYGSVTLTAGGTYLGKIEALPDTDFNAFAELEVTFMNLSINDFAFNDAVSLYPVPVTDILNISIADNRQYKKATLFNIDGSLIQRSTTQTMNLKGLATGLYILQIEDIEGNRAIKKIIKD
ncbi:T9SS type A sorting domain-containing protein [Aquimarina sp. ERC-38]|uniref:T9SS type A sorting domain-containing protein n=1 Tax=Aquimarina sp. ERC-38 TaxID=2949996 RepID=UPI002245B07B|nr:T9SS type A sorting domain-containing protein [Aquimarina sp. ERC-38]UZO80934.1 T9SS type A sorting domain-containing protein [Aquimarina sp. ERC-38]